MSVVSDALAQIPDFHGKSELSAFLSAGVAAFGLEVAKGSTEALINGEPVDLSWYDFGQASDLLALMQNAESREKEQFLGFVNLAWSILRPLIPGV